MSFNGYDRAADGDKKMGPPLGGVPAKGFVDALVSLNGQLTYEYRIESDKRTAYGTEHLPSDDRYLAIQGHISAWQSATRFSGKDPNGWGMFEVRLLSAVLTAKYNIAPAMLAEKEGRNPVRSALSFLYDLQVAAKVLALYTGADAETIEHRAGSQAELLGYLKEFKGA